MYVWQFLCDPMYGGGGGGGGGGLVFRSDMQNYYYTCLTGLYVVCYNVCNVL